MTPDKVKLSTESKRTFLELAFKHCVSEQQSASEKQRESDSEEESDSEGKLPLKERMKSLRFKFVKMLCVSNSYLICSRDTDFDIYRLNLYFDQNSDKTGVSFTSKCYESLYPVNPPYLCLNYNCVERLVKLLLPSHVGVYFHYDITDATFEQYLKLLQITKGKIGFMLDYCLKTIYVQTLLETFASRVYDLTCDMDRFKAAEHLQLPILDCFTVYSRANSDQISQILRYKTKELQVQINPDTQNFTFDDSDLVNLENKAVKKVSLKFVDINYVIVEKLVERLRKSCSNLKHFDIGAEFSHRNELTANQIYDQVIIYIRCMESLKKRFGNGLASMSIKFNVEIRINDQLENTWVKSVCKNTAFKDWTFKSYYGYRNKLKMTFDDAESHLEMTVNAYS